MPLREFSIENPVPSKGRHFITAGEYAMLPHIGVTTKTVRSWVDRGLIRAFVFKGPAKGQYTTMVDPRTPRPKLRGEIEISGE